MNVSNGWDVRGCTRCTNVTISFGQFDKAGSLSLNFIDKVLPAAFIWESWELLESTNRCIRSEKHRYLKIFRYNVVSVGSSNLSSHYYLPL